MSETGPYDLLVLAELNADVVVACDGPVRFGQVEQLVDHATITLGSSGAITAAAASALGLRVALCAVVGDDEPGRAAVDLLAATGVDATAVVRRPGRRTGMTVVLTRPDGDRALLTFAGTMADLGAADVPGDLLAAARHVHVSSVYLQSALRPGLPDLLARARSGGATTSLDPGWDPQERWDAVHPVLPHLDVVLPNAAECVAIAHSLHAAAGGDGPPPVDPVVAAATLQAHGPAVALKLGAAGAALVSARGLHRVAGRPVTPLDTTGAGDNFDAGFLSARLAGHADAEALARAVACGTLSLAGWGGTGALPSAAEADALAADLAPDIITEIARAPQENRR
ncbi:Sugar or nucleoside kinase, ribokinase family [Jatrophihabitans endophyticus]|uniref:Sugar or nucleoside kinase, ribokinase family n=1 Tax=Jatrophihabitans endophyticus TaxID=1206085 RepID=A0A1M5CKE1_9ACTN|nr:PfkB family carbohydrate kinase [Jatrophihabitans endophyticus]SHF55245.1 Sugar or nucleoside kinase, ribokinase family [Jatrophihabitans endophyticus]